MTTRLQLRTTILNQMLNSTSGTPLIPTTVVNEVINRAQIRVAHDFPAVEKLDSILMSINGGRSFELEDDFFKLNWAFKYRGDTTLYIQYMPPQYLGLMDRGRASNVAENTKDNPRYCWVSRVDYTGGAKPRIFFYPQHKSPSGTDTILISYYAIPDSLNSDADSTQIAYEYRDALIMYACALLAYRIGRWDVGQKYIEAYQTQLALSKASEIRQPFDRGYPANVAGE